ncbi:MAG: NfeD family protein, partial [Oligoflexus sp.]
IVSGSWLEVEIGIIGTASADILETALREVKDNNYAGLIIVLDTPGGALEATRTMVKEILAAPFPVIVWVGPSGAHAGSAGSFITLAGHFATMAPGTNIGAAHPVQGMGQDLEQGSDMRAKVENDTIAFMESIAKLRGRNVEMARSFVATSISITAEEALENKVIDLVAGDLTQVLKAADGRTVTVGEQKTVQLKTAEAQRVQYEKSIRQKFLEILSNPNLFYLLFIAGLLGIGFELTHPGTLVPGVIGAISLILALISSAVLPVNFGAMLLIVASVAFMVAEVFLPSFGILGIGGFIGFIVGSTLLVDSRNELGLAISWLSIIPSALVIAGFAFLVSYLVVRNQRSKIQSGSEGLIG